MNYEFGATTKVVQQIFSEYIQEIESVLKNIFQERYDKDEFAVERKLSPSDLNNIMALQPLSVAIPEKFGGRGGNVCGF